jgi:hypothetical protein
MPHTVQDFRVGDRVRVVRDFDHTKNNKDLHCSTIDKAVATNVIGTVSDVCIEDGIIQIEYPHNTLWVQYEQLDKLPIQFVSTTPDKMAKIIEELHEARAYIEWLEDSMDCLLTGDMPDQADFTQAVYASRGRGYLNYLNETRGKNDPV